jgi:hypothetical protein
LFYPFFPNKTSINLPSIFHIPSYSQEISQKPRVFPCFSQEIQLEHQLVSLRCPGILRNPRRAPWGRSRPPCRCRPRCRWRRWRRRSTGGIGTPGTNMPRNVWGSGADGS